MPMDKWDPFQDFVRLRNIFNELFDRTFQRQLLDDEMGLDRWAPHVDMYEDHDSIVVLAELPGVKQGDVNIEFSNNQLAISGERQASYRASDAAFHRVERRHGQFKREIIIPSSVYHQNIQASMDAGVLKVVLPLKDKEGIKKIPIKSNN